MTTTPFDIEAHVQRLTQDGYTIIEDFADAATLAQAREALAPHLGSHHGRNSFEGLATERVYTLVARGKVFERLTEEPRLLALLDRFLQPGYLLTASQAICIHPGEAAQAVHTDDGFYRQPRPRPAISLSIIGAVDEFTDTNGATDIIPGSHTWSDEKISSLAPEEVAAMLRPVTMPPRRRQPQPGAAAGLHQSVLRTLGPDPGELLSGRAARAGEGHVAEAAVPARLQHLAAVHGPGDGIAPDQEPRGWVDRTGRPPPLTLARHPLLGRRANRGSADRARSAAPNAVRPPACRRRRVAGRRSRAGRRDRARPRR